MAWVILRSETSISLQRWSTDKFPALSNPVSIQIPLNHEVFGAGAGSGSIHVHDKRISLHKIPVGCHNFLI
jgi:hypothetical protein